MDMLSESGSLLIKNTEYTLAIHSDLSAQLRLTLINKQNNHEYSNSFSVDFIEQMTQKTGNYKKFLIFVEMLVKCLKGHSCLSLDFAEIQEKHYLVLCYAIQFDRVFYPLPMPRTKDVHKQLELCKRRNEELASENEKLKEKLECVKNGLLKGTAIDSLLVQVTLTVVCSGLLHATKVQNY